MDQIKHWFAWKLNNPMFVALSMVPAKLSRILEGSTYVNALDSKARLQSEADFIAIVQAAMGLLADGRAEKARSEWPTYIN